MGLFNKNGLGDIEFEKEYEDRITGFKGFCVGISRFVSGCDQVLIVPRVKESGEYQSGQWFDDDRLVSVETGEHVERTSAKGGPNPTPSRTH